MAGELEGKVAAVTGGASGIGLASAEAMLGAGARVVLVDRDEAAMTKLREKHGDAVIPLVIDLLDPKSCATLLPQVLEKAGQLDILPVDRRGSRCEARSFGKGADQKCQLC
jgi:ribitol 2-dehydrogenase